MRIAEVAPLCESVPPRFYGGTERVVSWITEELVAQGHDVTLFASGDSAWNRGSTAEVIDEGVTGFIVDDVDGAAHAVQRALRLDRAACRRRFEQRFTAERMVRDYLAICERLVAEAGGRRTPLRGGAA